MISGRASPPSCWARAVWVAAGATTQTAMTESSQRAVRDPRTASVLSSGFLFSNRRTRATVRVRGSRRLFLSPSDTSVLLSFE